MSCPIWKNSVKEGFFPVDKESQIHFGLTGKQPTVDSSQNEQPPSFYDRLSKLSVSFNPSDAKNIYTDFIQSAKIGADGFKNVIAGIISGISPSSTDDDKGKLSRQVAMWIAVVPASYWLVINWWYVMCYTNYTIDFRQFVWNPVHWSMSPVLNAIELFNYYTLTFRMDTESKITSDFSRRLWNWRPVVFSVFHAVIVMSMMTFSATDAVMSSMLNTGIIFGFASILSIYYFFSLFFQEKWYEKFTPFGFASFLGLFGLMVLSFIGMFVFISVVCPVFTLYLSFLSYFVLLAFNQFWPPTVMSICNQIFQELKEAPVDDPIDKWGRLKNAAFQNTHSLYLLFMIFIILSTHITAATTFSSNSLMVTAIIINIILAGLFAPSAFTVVFELLSILFDVDFLKKEAPEPIIPESSISSSN
jgi:hypothetical protein